ncbi:hypothetical protein F5Y09DRAFT_168017 [Xylaria sp. FL1042]|nr:hypothetical protein F5Y09DRAFT_168017 [Xylaria sp. FL1042]
MRVQNPLSTASGFTHQTAANSLVDVVGLRSSNALSLNDPNSQHNQESSTTIAIGTVNSGLTFVDLPLEIREIIWRFALPEPRIFNALVWVSAGLKMQLLNRSELKMPLAHACFEARRVVKESGYVLAFRDEDEPEDPGVWFNPKRDRIERTIWGPGDWNTVA